MFKRRARHARRRARWVGPVFAVEALIVALSAKRELDAATLAQLAEYAQDGAR